MPARENTPLIDIIPVGRGTAGERDFGPPFAQVRIRLLSVCDPLSLANP